MTKLRFILLSALLIAHLSITFAQETIVDLNEVPHDTLSSLDTINIPIENLTTNDTANHHTLDSLLVDQPIDSLTALDTLKPEVEESSIKDVINYDAVDSILFNVAKQQATLYGRAHLDYDELEVDAPTIIVDFKNNILQAIADVDSNGKVIEYPVLKQGSDEFQAKEIQFNWRTNRGYIEDVYMKEGEGFVHTDQAYLDEDKSLYVEKASYTTCNLAEPHYHFKMQRAKVIPNDKIIASMVNLYIDDIPTPLALPFGLFPSKDIRSSGILLPTDFSQDNLGFYIKGFGYYWAISDRVVTKFTGEVYSKGTYAISNTTDYKVRYKYSGQITANYRDVVTANDEFGAIKAKTYAIGWTHSTDSRSSRNLTANVNYRNGSYTRFNLSEQEELATPNINSTVRLSLPLGKMFNSNISLGHNLKPTSIDGEAAAINTFNLPNFTLGYIGESNPYKKLPYTKVTPSKFRKNIMEQFNISYNMSGNNHASTTSLTSPDIPPGYGLNINETDTLNLSLTSEDLKEVLKRNKFYMTHTAKISNNLKLKAFTLTPSFNYKENWYFNQSLYGLNVSQTDRSVTISENPGFYRISRYSLGARLSTSFYNFYSLGRVRTKKIDGIEKTVDRKLKFRQTMQPSISFSSSPDYSNSSDAFQSIEYDTISLEYDRYLYYQGKASSASLQRTISFALNNTFEMKLPTKWRQKEGQEPAQPISLLNLNASANYNLAKDSIKLSNITINANNSRILNGLASVTSSVTFDPYLYDSTEVLSNGTTTKGFNKVDQFRVTNNKSLVRLTSFRINTTLNLNPKTLSKKDPNEPVDPEQEVNNSPYLDFSLPWTLRLAHTYNWSQANPEADTIKNNTLRVNGTLKLSENWATTFSINYDFQLKEFRTPSITLNRDLHCWQMGFTWVPFGPSYARRYNFNIAVKASMLKDLKYKKNSLPYDRANSF